MYIFVHSTGNKTVPGKVATTRTEDGHKQTTKTSTTIHTKRTKKHRTTEEEMEGPTSSWGSRNRLTCLTLQEHDDDDESVYINFHSLSRWFLPFSFLPNIAYVFIVCYTCYMSHPSHICWINKLYTKLLYLSIYGLSSFVVTLFLVRSNNFCTNRQTLHHNYVLRQYYFLSKMCYSFSSSSENHFRTKT